MSSPAKLIDILLVEDNMCDVELTRHVFETSKVGNRLHVVSTGEDALDFIYQRNAYAHGVRPDIVLLDINLPLKSGYDVLKILREDPVHHDIPVVMLTGSDMESRTGDKNAVHANCYLTKPVTFLSFIGAIQSLEEFWLGLVTLPESDNPKRLAS